MMELKSIERFLSSNSSVNPRPVAGTVVLADLKSQYRPDRIYTRDGLMKWDAIFNGVDSPYRMSNGTAHVQIDRTWLRTELNEVKDFRI